MITVIFNRCPCYVDTSLFFNRRSQINFIRPSAAWLLQHMQISLRNGIRVEQGLVAIVLRLYAAIYNDVRNLNIVRRHITHETHRADFIAGLRGALSATGAGK